MAASRSIRVVRPSDMFRMLEDSMGRFTDDFGLSAGGNSLMSIDVNVVEYSDRYEITAKVPGFTKEEIDISFEDNLLVISAETKEEKKTEEGNSVIEEYRMGKSKRAVSLPGKVDVESATAELKNGVMHIKLPKQAEVMPKKISIKAE